MGGVDPAGLGGHLPPLPLDRLLDELQARIDAARGTQNRVHGLLEAVLSVGRALDLPHVLRRTVESAVVLVGADHGALAVVEGTRLTQVLTVGEPDGRARATGPLPSGRGILGELIRHPEPLRLAECSGLPALSGFPPGGPPVNALLGVPIRVRGEVFGTLCLTRGRGGGEFDAEDETVLRTLAVAAGISIENAQLYKAAHDRQRWLRANAEIVAALLSGADEMRVFQAIVEHARSIAGADLGVLALPAENGAGPASGPASGTESRAGDGTASRTESRTESRTAGGTAGRTGNGAASGSELRVIIAVGTDADEHRGLVLPREGSFMGEAMAAGEPLTTAEIREDPRARAGPPRFAGLGPVVAVPMMTDEGAGGALLLAREDGAPPFSEAESHPLLGFAGQAALAMRLAGRRRAAEQLTVLEDRDRIARDLHDLAIQRLFATGMTLQSALRFVDRPEASERLLRAVDDLDETIKIIRSTIFGLRAKETARGRQGLRARAAAAVESAAAALGFTPALHMEGFLDTDVPAAVADDAVAVLTEALSNAARHARASAVEVWLSSAEGALVLTVVDNGVGLPDSGHRGGLRNAAARAERLGGGFDAGPGPEGGTRLAWRVPLPV